MNKAISVLALCEALLKPSSQLKSLLPQIVKLAQREYDQWDEDDIDTYAGGGICHFIADGIVELLDKHGILCTSVSATHEQHVYVVAQLKDGVFQVDIPPHVYETGGGFSWSKLPNVKFTPHDVVIYRLSSDPEKIKDYVDEWYDD